MHWCQRIRPICKTVRDVLARVLCSRAPWAEPSEFHEIFGIATWKLKHFYFGRPRRGLKPWRVFAPKRKEISHMACTDGQAVLYRTKPGQIVAKMLGGFSGNYFTKMKISRDPVDRFSREAVRFKINACSFRFWKREVQENSAARERVVLRF